jgi:hypothetical protein
VPDYLIIGKDTFQIFKNPLEAYFGEGERPKILDNFCSTACWRGYVAYWKLKDDSLFLVQLNSCCEKEGKIDLKAVFPNRNTSQPIFADWVSDSLMMPSGKLLNYIHMGYGSTYERETDYIFEKGIFKYKKEYLNSTIESEFKSMDSLRVFFQEHINWSNVPKTDTLVKVYLGIKVDKEGKIIDKDIKKSQNVFFNYEALRLVGLIKTMPVVIRRGNLLNSGWYLVVVFDPKLRKE